MLRARNSWGWVLALRRTALRSGARPGRPRSPPACRRRPPPQRGEIQELLAVAHRETIIGMADDVRVQMLVEMETNADSPRPRFRRIVVRNGRQPRRIR